jgi:RecJ-like exonuclease
MSGCEQKTINEIRAEPSRYANKEVSVVGTVTRSYSVLGRGVYEIDDGTGKLWIASEKGVPREGAKVVVKGKIRDGYNLGSFIKLPESISSGLAMIESSHKAR